ncbi:G protein-activated inward rectifier potassium channel 3-like isoform X1 [Oculina patagonica]
MSSYSDRSSNQVRRHWQRREAGLRDEDEYSDSGASSSDYSNMNGDSGEGGGEKYELKEVKIQQPNGTSHPRKNKTRAARGKKSRMKRVLSTKHVKKRRLVGKHGGLKVVASHVPQKHGMYISDLFTTMIDSKWRWITFVYITMYCGSWLGFGFFWWLITYFRGDNVCVDNVDSFTSAFLFSLETQTTIGYGGRQITPSCPEAVVLLNVQSLIGFIIGAFMLGLIFAKLSRPRNRAETILFSRNAVVAVRDGKMCLMFRVGDVRKSQILEAVVRVHLFRKRTTREGIELPFYQQKLPVGIDWSCEENLLEDSTLFLILPLTIVHVIDENSPLFEMHPKDVLNCDFEIVVVLEGTVEATSMLVQAKTSYIADEILWGHEFVSTTDESRWKSGRYRVDFSVFDDTRPVPTPQVSAKDYYEGKMFKMNSESSLLSLETQEDVDDDSDTTTQRPADITLNLDQETNGDTIAYV